MDKRLDGQNHSCDRIAYRLRSLSTAPLHPTLSNRKRRGKCNYYNSSSQKPLRYPRGCGFSCIQPLVNEYASRIKWLRKSLSMRDYTLATIPLASFTQLRQSLAFAEQNTIEINPSTTIQSPLFSPLLNETFFYLFVAAAWKPYPVHICTHRALLCFLCQHSRNSTQPTFSISNPTSDFFHPTQTLAIIFSSTVSLRFGSAKRPFYRATASVREQWSIIWLLQN